MNRITDHLPDLAQVRRDQQMASRRCRRAGLMILSGCLVMSAGAAAIVWFAFTRRPDISLGALLGAAAVGGCWLMHVGMDA